MLCLCSKLKYAKIFKGDSKSKSIIMKRDYRIYDTGKSTQDFSQLPPLAGRGERVNLMQQPL